MSGSAAFSVDGRPVVALRTRIPLWRPLDAQAKGDDVSSLQEALVSLGHSEIRVDGSYGAVTDKALRSVMTTAGMRLSPEEATPFDHILWLPTGEITTEACLLAVGHPVAAGEDIITLPARLSSITIKSPPANRLPGARELRLGNLTIPTNEDGGVQDPTALDTVATSPDLLAGVTSSDPAIDIEVEWRLHDPVTVAAVPPKALFGIRDTVGCVLVDGTPTRVTLVASSLGSSLIVFDNAAQAPTVVGLDVEDRSCG
ncbi:MAG: peptidoglycan-binding protein [Propionibacteriaceae bacterium]|jgi:hypothetical protein|nr:peptidoglycan-binding protein [Propionibacteriaceae bacterium]